MASNSTISTTFLIISDTHNFEFDNAANATSPLRLPTPQTDVVLHCGDLTHVGGVSSFKRASKMLGNIDAELKLVIPGNHDLELDRNYWAGLGDDGENSEDRKDHHEAVKVMTGPLAMEAGVTYLNEGTHEFTLKSGATFTIYVSPYTPEFCSWAFAYAHKEDRFNTRERVAKDVTSIATKPIPENINIVMTHGPPCWILDECPQGNVGCDNLLHAMRRARPKIHCFGRIHEGNGGVVVDWTKSGVDESIYWDEGQRLGEELLENPYPQPYVWDGKSGGRTLAVNAAIMTRDNKPEGRPWLVRLDLARAE